MRLPSSLSAILSLVLTVSVGRAENLVLNPGFEEGDTEWTEFVPPEHAVEDASWSVVDDGAHGGAACASMRSEQPIRWALSPREAFPVSAGEKYRVTAWVRFGDDAELLDENGVAYIRLTLRDVTGEDLPSGFGHLHVGLNGDVARNTAIYSMSVQSLPTGWQKIDGVVELPAETASVGINLFVHGVVGTVFWDDVSLEQVGDETPLSPIVE